jgi:hypothetical protein
MNSKSLCSSIEEPSRALSACHVEGRGLKYGKDFRIREVKVSQFEGARFD